MARRFQNVRQGSIASAGAGLTRKPMGLNKRADHDAEN
jgi:hypothetical protein